jgi:hypothetical protein
VAGTFLISRKAAMADYPRPLVCDVDTAALTAAENKTLLN